MIARHDMHLDDFKAGDRFESAAGYTFTDADIIGFAMRYDPQPFHIDAEAAKASIFGGLVASGFHSLAIAFRLVQQIGFLAHNLGGPGMDELRWLKPVRVGDTLRASAEVVEVTPSRSKPDRGALKYRVCAVNQRGETVLTCTIVSLVKRRGA